MKTWLASDLHLGHKNIVDKDKGGWRQGLFKYPDGSNQPFEEYFLRAWEESVSDKDTIYLLGDIAFSTTSYWFNRLAGLPGQKRLLLGNHDRNRVHWYSKFGFDVVVAFGEGFVIKHDYGNVLLTHVPAFPEVFVDDRYKFLTKKYKKMYEANRCVLSIHGHTHGQGKEVYNTVDVSLECINYAPINLEQVMGKLHA